MTVRPASGGGRVSLRALGAPASRDGRLGQAAHRARGQGPAVAGRLRTRPGPGGAVPGLPRPAPGLDPVDRQSAADPVRPARRRGRPARAARARRCLARGLHRRLRGPGPGRGAPPDVRGRHPGGVLAGVFGLLVGRGRHLPPGPVAVPGGGSLVRGGRGPRLGRRAAPGRGEPAAGHGGRGRLAGHSGWTALRGGPRGRGPRRSRGRNASRNRNCRLALPPARLRRFWGGLRFWRFRFRRNDRKIKLGCHSD